MITQHDAALQTVREMLPPDRWVEFYERFRAKLHGLGPIADLALQERGRHMAEDHP